ncbi:MAG: aminodeoxychorismate synthase component I [Rhodoluna sp.]|nr:aminodeoxychorismate synthase component I [Rhodoluna sp.]
MRLYCERLEGWTAPADAFVTLHAKDELAFWLDREHSVDDRFSVIGSGKRGLLGELVQSEESIEAPFAFRPGLVGVFGYESKHDAFLAVDRALVFDHESRHIWFIGSFENKPSFDNWVQAALLRLALVGGETAAYRSGHAGSTLKNPTLRHSPERYLELIEKAQRHIAAGDVYQLCLTNELTASGFADPLETFLRLRALNPTPYATYLKLGATAIVCTSPEQFLRVTSGGLVSSKPIKGTRRRDADPARDAELALELANNEKERAENLMIVDLMRNDIGQVCEASTVSVPKLFEVETYKTVHQLVSTVVGQLREDKTSLDAIKAAFPGGSMTGAPKARAMELILELEAGERGVYSGAIGYLGLDGSVDLGMVIRTIIFTAEGVRIGIGGGITSDSIATEELEETHLKAKALLEALGLEDPWSW